MPNRDEMPKRITPGIHPWELNLTDRDDEGPEQELADWWMNTAADEVRQVVPKAVAYGSGDLIEIGRQIANIGHLTLTEAKLAELGCAYYAYGKLARIMSSYADGRWPSDDSWHDLVCYAKMTQRIRAVGAWPGIDLTETESDR